MSKIFDLEKRLKELEQPKMYCGIIYKYTNLINGKIYVGQTINEEKRKKYRISCVNSKRSNIQIVEKAIRKYGYENFKYDILEKHYYSSLEDMYNSLDILEIYYIDKYESYIKGYNETKGGEGSKGYKHSQNTKNKIGKAHKGKIIPEWHRKRISEKNSGRKLTEEHIKQISIKNSGKHFSKEHRDKISKGRKGIIISEETRKKMSEARKIPINQYSLDGIFIRQFGSIKEAAEYINGDSRHICRSLKNFKFTHKGYRWKYAKEDL